MFGNLELGFRELPVHIESTVPCFSSNSALILGLVRVFYLGALVCRSWWARPILHKGSHEERDAAVDDWGDLVVCRLGLLGRRSGA